MFGKRKKKHSDLQPWLDYFDMLREHIYAGYLQMDVKKHEAFVTQPAFFAMSDGDDPLVQMRDGSIEKTALRLRTYAAWLATEGEGYMHQSFAIHVVRHEEPHDPLFTILLSQRRRLLRWHEKIEVVTYPEK